MGSSPVLRSSCTVANFSPGSTPGEQDLSDYENSRSLEEILWLRVKGQITFSALGLLHKCSSLLSQALYYNVNYFLGNNFATVHELRSTGENLTNARRHSDSNASLCIAICFHITISA
ncbi:hypothetical protein BsWGS_17132 [Bradybaena similaris]